MVSNVPPTGSAAGENPLSTTLATPSVLIGGEPVQFAPDFFSGLAPGYLGVYQINVRVPPDSATGDAVPVALRVGEIVSNTVTMAVQ
jgi:uncharacterized protein (TIGR03437 family)